jgi:phage FluMu gp28-like protein
MNKIGKKIATAIAAAGIAAGAAGPSAPGLVKVETAPSVIKFDPSQRAMFEDTSRVIVVVWHRQKGKDFTAAAKAVRHALKTGQSWFIVSLTQRQADATFDKCKAVCKIFMTLLAIVGTPEEGSYPTEQYDKELKQSFTFLAREIRLPGGGRVVSLPGRDPDTLAGLTGNVIFTEFGLFPNGGYDHWRVVFPLTTRGFTCIVISTPRGKNTKFYELFVNDGGAYSVHFCDIHHSIAHDEFVLRDNEGNKTDIDTFKKLYGDATGFEREYECKFSGDASSLVTWAELERAAELGLGLPFDWVRVDGNAASKAAEVLTEIKSQINAGARVELGWDVARTGHLSVLSLNLAKVNRPKHLRFVLGMRGCRFEFQRGFVIQAMKLQNWSVGLGDATGLGMESNETLATAFPKRWEGFTFTGPGKRDLASGLKTAFNDGTQTLPSMSTHKFIAADIYAIQQDSTGANISISETVNPLLDESHCDIGFSLGLARLAGAKAPVRGITHSGRKPVGC